MPRKQAELFFTRWQNRLFERALKKVNRQGFVYVPLQGRLRDHRSFQFCTPLQMIEHVLDHDSKRPIIATLHPNEIYSQAEIDELEALSHQFPRLRVETGQMERWLMHCDYVVSQNSSAAFAGYSFEKPSVLFGQIDFAHIANQTRLMGVTEAIQSAPDLRPDYSGYIHSFWQIMAINAGRSNAKAQIAEAFERGGWPMNRNWQSK